MPGSCIHWLLLSHVEAGSSPVELDDSDEAISSHKRPCRRPACTAQMSPATPATSPSRPTPCSEEEDRQGQGAVLNAISTSANENGGVCLHLPPDMDEYDDPFTLCVVESYSAACLHRRWLAFDQLNALVDMLPTTTACRHESVALPAQEDRRSMTFGAFAQGPLTGLRSPTKRYPMTTRLLNAVVYTMAGARPHTTLFLARNMSVGLHADANNAHTPNILIPLSTFEGGHLFIEDEKGDYELEAGGPRGNVHPVTLPFLSFDASKRHLVLPWSGRRLILGA